MQNDYLVSLPSLNTTLAIESFIEYKYLVLSSLYRYEGRVSARAFLRQYLAGEGFKYIFWLRTCAYLRSGGFLRGLLFWPAFFMLRRWGYKLGISIPWRTEIGPGSSLGTSPGSSSASTRLSVEIATFRSAPPSADSTVVSVRVRR